MKKINEQKLEQAATLIIEALNDDTNRAGLKETPKRFAHMICEVLEGMNYTNEEIASKFDKCFEENINDDLVVMKDISAFSFCEHHLALIYNMKVSVAYLPSGKVIGLSKIARIVDMVSKRLQLQEKIGTDIVEVLNMILDTDDIMVVIEAEHACMTTRGIKKPGTVTKTSTTSGIFKTDYNLKNEVYELIK